MLLCAALALLAAGCGRDGTDASPMSGQQPGGAVPSHPAADGLPPLPGPGGPASGVRRTSDSDLTVAGSSTVRTSGPNVSPDPVDPSALIIIPGGEDDLAWAVYTVPGLNAERPVTINIEADAIVPGGEDDLAYWVMLANYSTGQWEPRGPFSGPTMLTLNSAALHDRYVSAMQGLADPSFSYAVATVGNASSGDGDPPDEQPQIKVEQSVTTVREVTAGDYVPTTPHAAPVGTVSKGSSAVRRVSAVDSVELTWTHIADDVNEGANAAAHYQIARMGPGDDIETAKRVDYLIGTVPAPEESYTDPDDNNVGIPPLAPGTTYRYWVRAVSPSSGGSGWVGWKPGITIDLPEIPGVSATTDDESQVLVTWEPVTGVKGYRVLRDVNPNPAGATNISGPLNGDAIVEYSDTTAEDGVVYTYWVVALGEHAKPGPGDDIAGPLGAGAQGRLSAWTRVVIDDGELGQAGTYCSMTTLADGSPAIAYTEVNGSAVMQPRFASCSPGDGTTGWRTVDIPETMESSYCSLALVNGTPAISYYGNGGALMYAYTYDPSGDIGWDMIQVDESVQQSQSRLVEAGGFPAIAYVDNGVNLRVAYSSQPDGAGGWATVEVDPSTTAADLSMAIVGGKPCISYWDFGARDLKYAYTDDVTGASGWTLSVIEAGQDDIGADNSITAIGNSPVVYYRNYTTNTAKVAFSPTFDGSLSWQRTDIGTAFNNGFELKAIGGLPALAYGYPGMEYARSSFTDGSGPWEPQQVQTLAAVDYASITEVDGRPAVCYHELGTDALIYAIRK